MYMAKTNRWYLERIIWVIAGTLTLGSSILAWFVSKYWLILTALVGVNLLIFGFTGFCLMAAILHASGARSGIDSSPSCCSSPGTIEQD